MAATTRGPRGCRAMIKIGNCDAMVRRRLHKMIARRPHARTGHKSSHGTSGMGTIAGLTGRSESVGSIRSVRGIGSIGGIGDIRSIEMGETEEILETLEITNIITVIASEMTAVIVAITTTDHPRLIRLYSLQVQMR